MVETNYVHISCSSRNTQWKNTVKEYYHRNIGLPLRNFGAGWPLYSPVPDLEILYEVNLNFRFTANISNVWVKTCPFMIETGRYENLEVADRTCPFCGKVEDEKHAIFECNVYNDLRE